MGVIVAGKLIIQSGRRDAFIEKSQDVVLHARQNQACEDFSVSPDPIDMNRVNIFEKWTSYAELYAFRASGPDNELLSLVELFDVKEYDITP